ncbi:hypothetical protein [Nocardia sp. alder85J]|uniref:hypothetical protein n=1 Tax=Nocardia sp. alder85J TaxID=2862949 RepID=UPI001CD40D75|nr:hypothetical protein [Nocardia sp. alder85J]MCX4098372.1 hypothetical protein [Nocardia sp. alder85J]
MKIRPVVIAVLFAAATAVGAGWTTAAAAPLVHSDIPAGDCAVLKQIGSSTVSTLAPLQSQSPDQAAAGMAAYVAQLRSQEGQVSSPEAQADIENLASALENATGPESASSVYGAIGKLNSAC